MELEISRHRDQVDWSSPAVDPLDFPVPTIFECQTMKILARDHRTGEQQLVKALLKRGQGTHSAQSDNAYLLKKTISRSGDGQEKTWAAVVLVPASSGTRSSAGHESPVDAHWESTNRIVAIQVSSWRTLSHSNKQRLVQEVSALQYVGNSNQHVQGCLEILKDDERIYTIMPYCLERSLASYIEPAEKTTIANFQPNEDRARTCFKELCTGLLHLQQKGMYHGNIFPGSIFFSDNQTLVLDDLRMSLRVPFSDPFNDGYIIPQGLSRRLLRNRGSRSDVKYQAPEVTASGFDAFASDVWSAGIVLFVLLAGITPFKRPKASDVVFKVVSSGHLRELLESWDIALSSEACDLLQSIFRRRPTDRITLSEIMEHPWVLGTTLPQRDQPEPPVSTRELPFSYSGQAMTLLRNDIVRQQRKKKPTLDLDRTMRQSLRRELILRTSGNAKLVSFGHVEILPATTTSGFHDSSCRDSRICQVDQYEQDRYEVRCSRRRQALATVQRSEETEAATTIESEKKAACAVHRHVSPWKKLVRSAKKKLKTVAAKKVRVDVEGPVLVTARSA